MWRYWFGFLMLLGFAFGAFFFTLDFELTWDDVYFQTLDPLTWHNAASVLLTLPFSEHYMRPVAVLSFYLQRELASVFGWSLMGMRHMHLLLFTLYALVLYALFFAIVWTFFARQALLESTRALWTSVALAFIFSLFTLLHPANAEIIGWASARFDLLGNLFLCWASLVLWRLLERLYPFAGMKALSLKSVRFWYLFTLFVLLNALALGSKEFAFTHMFLYALLTCSVFAGVLSMGANHSSVPMFIPAQRAHFLSALYKRFVASASATQRTSAALLISSLVLLFIGALALHQSPLRKSHQVTIYEQTEHVVTLPARPNFTPLAPDERIELPKGSLKFAHIPVAALSDWSLRAALFFQGFTGQLSAFTAPWVYSARHSEYTIPMRWQSDILIVSGVSILGFLGILWFLSARRRAFVFPALVCMIAFGGTFSINPATLWITAPLMDTFSDRFLSPALPFLSLLTLLVTLANIYPQIPLRHEQRQMRLRRSIITLLGIVILHAMVFFPNLHAWRSDFTRAHYYAMNSPQSVLPANHLVTQYQAMGIYDDALTWAQKASDNAKGSWPLIQSQVNIQLANLLYLNDQFEQAKRLSGQHSKVLLQHQMYNDISEHNGFLGQIALDKDNIQDAFAFLDQSTLALYHMQAQYQKAIAFPHFYHLSVRLALHTGRPDIAWASYLKMKEFKRLYGLSATYFNVDFLERQLCSGFIDALQKHADTLTHFTPDARFVLARPVTDQESLALLQYTQTCTPSSGDKQKYPAVRFTKPKTAAP